MGTLRLAGTCWKLNAFRQGDQITPAVPGVDSTLGFDGEGRADGFGGRSAFQALYNEAGEEISILGFETAREAGTALPGAAEQEERFLAGLAAASRFKLLDSQLILTWSRGREALLFEAAKPHFRGC
ncbi:MAG TPA: META domain-containing protein [Thermoanaerobaculia bacterium]|nr:META domain-containing protein [Thermoanaerobaculia bacterium]